MKTLKYTLLLIINILFIGCADDENDNISDEDLVTIGNKLAEWGNCKCNFISVNDKNLLWSGPNSGGCSPIYFVPEFEDREERYDFEKLKERYNELGIEEWLLEREIIIRSSELSREEEVKTNLREAIESSECNVSVLKSIDCKLSNIELTDILECMGQVNIEEGPFGIE